MEPTAAFDFDLRLRKTMIVRYSVWGRALAADRRPLDDDGPLNDRRRRSTAFAERVLLCEFDA